MNNLNRIRNLLKNKIRDSIRKGEILYASTKDAGSIPISSARVTKGVLLLETLSGTIKAEDVLSYRTEKFYS